MTLQFRRISSLPWLALGAAFLTTGASAQNRPSSTAPQSPYGGVVVEDILARVNDQVISKSDYERAMKEMDDDARQKGASMQQIAEAHKDLLRNLVDQQLWLSKAKELNITGETELVKQLDEIRKKYNLASMEDLEKAAREQGVSYEDFKANIRNQIVTQQVMREEVGRKVSFTPGEVQRYFEAHKQEYAQPENVHLGEILVATNGDGEDKLATAKAKADDIEARLKAGEDFDKIARSSSDGQTAAEGGDMGKFQRGQLAKVLEDDTFGLKPGEFTAPIRTKQGYVIMKVVEHNPGGAPAYKDVQDQVEEAFYMSRMEPAMRGYLTQMREEAYIDIKPGYVDTGASPGELKSSISYAAYTPPSPKKKKKVQRTRFRETERGFRNKNKAAVVPVAADTTPAKTAPASTKPDASMKAGKKEKIRFGQAPRETLPNATATKTEDAGALPKTASNDTDEPENPLHPAPPAQKTRFSERAKLPKTPKPKGPQLDTFTPAAPDAAEVADRQTQAAPLGLSGDTSKKKKKTDSATVGQKTRKQQEPKKPKDTTAPQMTVPAPVQGAPAPAKTDQPADAPAAPPVAPPATTPDPQR